MQIPREKLDLVRSLGAVESLVQSMMSQLPDCGILYICFLQKMKSFLQKSFLSEPIHPQLLVNLDFVRKTQFDSEATVLHPRLGQV